MSGFRFMHPVEVRYGDLDPQGHLNNAKYLTFFEQARVCYWAELGLFSPEQAYTEMGVIIADVHISYTLPVRWGDTMDVGVRTAKIGNKSLTVEQCLVEHSSGQVHATGIVVLVAYDYVKHAAMRVPDDWRERLQRYEESSLS